MKIYFEKTLIPCICNPITLWHVSHGWIWNVREQSGQLLGVCYATLLCADGAIVHFDTIKGIRIAPSAVRRAFEKALTMILPRCSVLYATVPAEFSGLIKLLARFNFRVVTDGGFFCCDRQILLLKYFENQKCIL